MTITNKAMLSSVRIKQWSGRKLDKDVTAETNRAHNAAADAGRYNKALISKDALAEIVAVSNRARKEQYARTLPWHDDGNRILSAAGYLDYTAAMRELRREFDAAVSTFLSGYDAFVADARIRLNGMFKASDYPAAQDIAGRFNFDIVIQPMPDASDFRVDVSSAEAEAIRADIQARTDKAIRDAMGDVFGRVCETVGHMSEKLRAYAPSDGSKGASGIFRDSLVDNVRELVALLPSLNITGDSVLSGFAQRMEAELCKRDAAELRDDANLRKETADAAAAILRDVNAYIA